jgi:DNA-binding MarR family transcriptional regulator
MQAIASEPVSFGHRIRTVARRIDRAMLDRIARHGLTLPQYYVLRELFVEEGITQRELSARLNATEPGTVVTLRRMEAAGLVVRTRDGRDRRKINVSLSPKGKALRGALQQRAGEVNALMRRGLSEADVARFRALLDRIDDNLRSAERRGGSR